METCLVSDSDTTCRDEPVEQWLGDMLLGMHEDKENPGIVTGA